MALTRSRRGQLAVQALTVDGDASVEIPAMLSVDASGNAVNGVFATSDLTGVRISFNAITDQTIVTATASQTTRVHRLRLSVAGATNISIKDGAGTVLEIIQFAAAGALILDFSTRPYWKTTVNTSFILLASAAVQVEGRIEYIKSA